MDKKDDIFNHEDRWLKDLPDEETVPRFSAEQMVECAACARRNPPTRLNCFYCGAALEISEKNRSLFRPNLRKLESWEKGYNIVNLPPESEFSDNQNISEISGFLQLERDLLRNILAARVPLPLARVDGLEEAGLIKQRLTEYGLTIELIADEALQTNLLPRRVRTVIFDDDFLTVICFGTDERLTISWNDFKLFVTGMIIESRRESSALRKRRESVIKDTGETSSDEQVLDFYIARDEQGFRIPARSFDFSSLGERKGLMAGENFKILINELKRRSPRATFDENYRQVRQLLSSVWEIEERKESIGWKHEGVGKISTSSITKISNAEQFTRYSRLMAKICGQR